MKALSFGEILWDIIEGKAHLGGAPLNFAAHVVKCGGEAAIVSAVGNDNLGTDALSQVESLQVGTSMVCQLEPYKTGTVDVFLENGQPDYTIHEKVAFDHIPLPESARLLGGDFDVFYFGTLAQRGEVSRAALRQLVRTLSFRHIFYDINLRKQFYTKEIISWSLQQASIFKVNEHEAEVLSMMYFDKILSPTEFSAKISSKFEVETIVITAAEKGCYVYHEGEFFEVPGVSVQVVDAIGAGDSFSAAFLTRYLLTGNVLEAARVANRVGAFVASSRGAIPEYPFELESILKS
ncbi:MAG: carbohydrate kinase [Bacteroidetes bacterium]|nr:carbohydrate kinase [Bacteroidota bacterium]